MRGGAYGAAARDRLESAGARVLASPRKSASRHETPGLTFRSFLRASLEGLLSDERPVHDEPRDVPFKVSGIRLPARKKNIDEWTGGGLSFSHSLSLPRASSSYGHPTHTKFLSSDM